MYYIYYPYTHEEVFEEKNIDLFQRIDDNRRDLNRFLMLGSGSYFLTWLLYDAYKEKRFEADVISPSLPVFAASDSYEDIRYRIQLAKIVQKQLSCICRILYFNYTADDSELCEKPYPEYDFSHAVTYRYS